MGMSWAWAASRANSRRRNSRTAAIQRLLRSRQLNAEAAIVREEHGELGHGSQRLRMRFFSNNTGYLPDGGLEVGQAPLFR